MRVISCVDSICLRVVRQKGRSHNRVQQGASTHQRHSQSGGAKYRELSAGSSEVHGCGQVPKTPGCRGEIRDA